MGEYDIRVGLTKNYQVLVGEDDAVTRKLITAHLENLGYRTLQATNGQEVNDSISTGIDLVLLDLTMPVASGFDCLSFIKEEHPNIPVVVVSGAGIQEAVRAMKSGAFWYVQKPINGEELNTVVRKALQYYELKARNEKLQEAVNVLKRHLGADYVEKLEQVLMQACTPGEALDLAGTKETQFITTDLDLAGMPLKEVEERAIRATLEGCKWNKAAAARTLGISEKSIYNKIKRYGIEQK